jgi:hypothetical protein
LQLRSPELRDITERWHGLSDMKPNGRVLGHVRSLQMFSERMFVSKQTMVGLDAVNAEVFDGCDVADWYLADVQGPSSDV